ncbi:MAG: SDR family oxidoreductase [Stappiaceae bacterium]
MSEKSILITGCSSGIGAAAVTTMKERGWTVFATARSDTDLARLNAAGVTALYLDYREPDSIVSVATQVLEETGGKLFALYNNGAYGQLGAVEDLPTAALREQFEANFFGWHDLTCRLLPSMRANGRGRIVQCSSVLGMVAMKHRGAYVASKFALEGLSDALRQELRGSGIHVSVIAPGPIATKFLENALNAFYENINRDTSPHRDEYNLREKRIKTGGASAFKLQPSAVVDRLIHAVESDKPKPNYYVTTPTYLMNIARRLLSRKQLDWFLARTSDKEIR